MSNKTSLLELIKNKKLKEIENILKNDRNVNLNITDTESFIYYVLMFNYENILDLVLKHKNISRYFHICRTFFLMIDDQKTLVE